MQVSKEEIAHRFDKYNKAYFGGVLGKCRFSYIHSRALGTYVYDSRNKVASKIIICKRVDWTEEVLKATIIHEMVHMYLQTVLHRSFCGLFGHGRQFRKECRRLKRKWGLNVLSPRL